MNRDNLFTGLGEFLEAMRAYIVALLSKEHGKEWYVDYYETLSPKQQSDWEHGLRSGSKPETLIDYHNLKGFAIRHMPSLRDDFGRDTSKLPTWFEELAEIRHRCNHYEELREDDFQLAYLNMLRIARQLKMSDLEATIEALRDDKRAAKRAQSTGAGLVPWFKNVVPHRDIREGHLDESIFAANLAEVAGGNGREVYQNPAIFFKKSYFTAGLKTVSRRVVKGLNGEQDAENRVISLQTGFGGGKTHTLISLYHMAKLGANLADSSFAEALIKSTGQPKFKRANVAVFTNHTCDPTQGHTLDGQHIKTLWGSLAWQLGGAQAYDIIRANDENRTAPKGLFHRVLEQSKPALILIDELADYCVSASGVEVGGSTLSDQTISFIQELSESVAAVNHCVLVATLPASAVEVANSPQASQIFTSLSNRLSRVGADTKPVADDEIYEVIRRRLFEEIGNDQIMDAAIQEYSALYAGLWTEVPDHVMKGQYKETMRQAYPFHPELIDMFRVRWASHHDFQRTRGVLRLLASIVSDLWKRQGSLAGTHAFIHTSDVNFANLDALSEQLKKLYGNGYDAVLTADVSGSSANAFKIDSDKKEYGDYNLAQGVASTILLGTFGSSGANKGLSVEEIKLAVLKPNAFNHNSVNGVLDVLESRAHYLYYSTAGTTSKRYWFHTKPNINILINQAKSDVAQKQIQADVLQRLQSQTLRAQNLNILINPSDDIPEQKRLAMIVLGPDCLANPETINGNTLKRIEHIATKRGTAERIYRNTILFLACSEIGATKLFNDSREYLACVKIRDDYQSQLEADQKEDIRRKIDEYNKQVNSSLIAAYTILLKHSALGVQKLIVKQFRESLDVQISSTIMQLLKDEEWLLDAIGIRTLEKNNLLPTPEKPIRCADIYEAFLRYDDKPMITGQQAIQSSLQRYCLQGEFAVAAGEADNFNKTWYKETISYFDVSDPNYWIIHKSLVQPQESPADYSSSQTPLAGTAKINEGAGRKDSDQTVEKSFKTITISGAVDVANYHQIFTSFIQPLIENKVEINIKITGKSTSVKPLSESSTAYKIAKESAKQLGLGFEEE